MGISINVGKNVATILGHEFPIDTDLTIGRHLEGKRAWKTESIGKAFSFNPVVDGEVSAETFVTYNQALHESVAFNRRGKMRKLFDHKEEGVKIVPGHGVFFLPSKMTVVHTSPRKIKIRVFGGTDLAREFHHENKRDMVGAAANYYYDHIREVTDSVNESLWYPVKYNRSIPLECNGLAIPDGVRVYTSTEGRTISVEYTSREHGTVHVGTATNASELGKMINTADRHRQKELQANAVHRFINPSFVQLSQYMRRV